MEKTIIKWGYAGGDETFETEYPFQSKTDLEIKNQLKMEELIKLYEQYEIALFRLREALIKELGTVILTPVKNG